VSGLCFLLAEGCDSLQLDLYPAEVDRLTESGEDTVGRQEIVPRSRLAMPGTGDFQVKSAVLRRKRRRKEFFDRYR
jgi:hypothetical protein